MIQPNKYQGNAFDPAVTYGMEFDAIKNAPMVNLMAEYTTMMEVEDSTTDGGYRQMTRIMQTKETIRKFQGICAEELLYTSDKFFVKAKDMDMDDEQMWKDWPKCLEHAPRKVWDLIIQMRTYNNNKSGLTKATKQLLKHYAKDPPCKEYDDQEYYETVSETTRPRSVRSLRSIG